MSMSTSGRARRSFIIGNRLWPPATSRASGPWRSSNVSALSTLVASSYSNGAGVCTFSPSVIRTRPGGVARPQFQCAPGRPSCLRAAKRRLIGVRGERGESEGRRRRRSSDDGRADECRAMTLTQLEAFVLVARLGSVKAAAQVLGVSEPAVSGALAALRQHLGDPLVVRAPGGMDLTPGGQRLVPIASQMVNLAVEAEGAIRRAQGAPELLRVVATSAGAEYVARPLLTAFTARHGPVEATLGVTTASEMPALLHERLADVGLGPPLPALETKAMMRYRLVVVAGPRHCLASTAHVGPPSPPGPDWLVHARGADPPTAIGVVLGRPGGSESPGPRLPPPR